MTLPNPVSKTERNRSYIRKQKGAPYKADLIADNGAAYVQDNPGYVWVREILSVDPATGAQVYGQAYQVRGVGSFPVIYGLPVIVKYNPEDDEWDIDRPDFVGMIERDIHPGITNSLNPYLNFVSLLSLPPLKTYAVSKGDKQTTEVGIKNLIYIDYLGDLKTFSLDLADRPDIADNVPGAGLKRLVHLWLQADGTIATSVSSPINAVLPFDISIDLAEVIASPPDNMSLPIGAWKIENGQTAITDTDLIYDTRQWLNVPQALGLPNPITKTYRIPAGVTVDHRGGLDVQGGLIVEGSLIVHDKEDVPLYRSVTVEEILFASQIRMQTLRFYDADNSNYTQLSAPALSADLQNVLPSTLGAVNQIIFTDGSGNWAWGTIGDLGGGIAPSIVDGSVLYWDDPTMTWLTSTQILIDPSVGDRHGGTTNYAQHDRDGILSFNGISRIDWTKNTADSVTLSVGSTPSSLVADLQTAHDGNLYHIDEAGGVAPSITLIVDFVSVTAFNWVQVIAEYDGSATHSVCVELYNWNSAAWNVFDAANGVETALTNHSFFVPDDTNYIGTGGNIGEVRVRFNHPANGNGAHDFDIDVVALYQ